MPNNDLKNKISIATYGSGIKLDSDSNRLADIVKQTSMEVSAKFGKRLDNKIVDNVTNLNLSNLFLTSSDKKPNPKKVNNEEIAFRELMENNSQSAISMLTAEQDRTLAYSNYKAIVDNIPEMALARDTYVSNILSPDDYNKAIFNITYDSVDVSDESRVQNQIKHILEKYKLEEMTESIVGDTLTYGDCFVSILPYDREIGKFLAQSSQDGNGMLNESSSPVYTMLMENMHLAERMYFEDVKPNTCSEILNEEEKSVLYEVFGDSADINSILSNSINKNVKVRSFTDMLMDRASADNDIIFNKQDVELKKDKNNKHDKKLKTLNINGAVVKKLAPERVVPLEVDGVCYGYYYIEPGFGMGNETPYNANNPAQYAQASNPMNPTLQPKVGGANTPGETAANPEARNLNITDEKLNVISGVMLKCLSKKLNKNYINNNKQFKDLLYSLLKQKYIFEKGISITFLMPEEVIHFKINSIFEKIVFFAKLYLAILTNAIIVKLGRGHDKRIFYVQTGADTNHEQAIMKTIQDVKTKEFRMSNMGSISSILQLNPGIMDDYYMPVIAGERPVDIETLAGMDQDISTEFSEFLKKSMIQGTGLPQALIEASDSIEFARQITAQNAQFCRRVINYQKQLTPGFNDLVRLLYKYEYQYSLDANNQLEEIDLSKISIQFPSPGSLNLANMIEQLSQVDTAADYITKRFIPDKMDQSNIDEQITFKTRVIEKMTPQINWSEFDELYKSFKDEFDREQLLAGINIPPEQTDNQYSGY